MVNKPFRYISDNILASSTFGCVKMSDFVPNIRPLKRIVSKQKVYGDAALNETTFRSFVNGDFDVYDRPLNLLWAVDTERNHHWEMRQA